MLVDINRLGVPLAIYGKDKYEVLCENEAFVRCFKPFVQEGSNYTELLDPPHSVLFGTGLDKVHQCKLYCSTTGKNKHFKLRPQELPEGYLLQVDDCSNEIYAEEQFTAVIETSFDGFWDWNLVTGYEYMSPQFWKMFGYDPSEKKNDPAGWKGVIHPDDLKAALECFEQHVATKGKSPYFLEARYIHKNGSIVRVICKGRVIQWQGDVPIRMVGTHTDVTLLMETKEALFKAEASAEKRLNEFIAHEMRNPLFAAVTAAEFLREACEQDEGLSPVIKSDLSALSCSLSYIEELVNSSLDLEKCLKGGVTLNKRRVNLRKILEDVRNVMTIRNSCVPIEVVCESSLDVFTDSIRIKQVVMNLASNAVKFTRIGKITLRGRVSEGNALIFVEDTGPGISESVKKKLFAREVVLQDENQGNGIGLCLCKTLVELMDGTIYVNEKYDAQLHGNKGCQFVVQLPSTIPINADKESLRDNAVSSKECEPLMANMKVLIVDDDSLNRKLMRRKLQRFQESWTFYQAVNGEQCLKLCTSEKFSIILMDQFMSASGGILTGAQTVEVLRSSGVDSIIIGFSGNDVQDSFMRAGANLFWRKPIAANEVLLQDLGEVMLGQCR